MQTFPKAPSPENSQNRYIITSAYRTLEILRAFSVPPHRFSLAELVVTLKMDKGQTYRSLKTLEEAGFIRANEDGRFSLTPLLNVLSVAAISGQSASLAEVAAPQLSRLSDETGESVHLFDLAGRVVGAISVGRPSYRVDDAQLRSFSTLIVQGAQAISRQLGYAG